MSNSWQTLTKYLLNEAVFLRLSYIIPQHRPLPSSPSLVPQLASVIHFRYMALYGIQG